MWAFLILSDYFGNDAIDAIAIRMEAVVAELEVRDQENDQTGGEADSKSEDIDHRMNLVFPQLADGDKPVVFEHGVDFCWGRQLLSGWIRWAVPSQFIKASASQLMC